MKENCGLITTCTTSPLGNIISAKALGTSDGGIMDFPTQLNLELNASM